MAEENKCPQCGAKLPVDAPQGLCPKCLMKLGLPTGAGPDKAYAVEWSDESYYAATLGGFVFIRASTDELVVEFVRLDAKTQYAHVIAK